MISYLIIYFANYYGHYTYLPLFQGEAFEEDFWAQAVRHLIVFYLSLHLTNFLWRQKFVSTNCRKSIYLFDYI